MVSAPIRLVSPVKAVLPEGLVSPQLIKDLTYTNKKVLMDISRLKRQAGYLPSDVYHDKLSELMSQKRVCVLNDQDTAEPWVASGLASWLSAKLNVPVVREYTLPETGLLPWDRPPSHDPRPYQLEAERLLLDAMERGPVAVSIGTGLGKSLIALRLAKAIGLKSVIMAPSVSIAGQLYDDFALAFGRKRVGMYGDGKKEHNKLITIAVAQSLTRIEPGSPAWLSLSQADLFVADESHMTPASTLQKVCFGLMAKASRRVFLSATQLRSDGLDIVLKGIIGEIVFEMTVREGVDQGWLSKPHFTMVQVESNDPYVSRDVNRMTRRHLFYNPNVLRAAADLVNRSVRATNKRVLVLIEEIEQFTRLRPLLQADSRFAHGTLNDDNKKVLPEVYWKSDPKALVKAFDAGEFPVLVGTSCISTGTDIKSAGVIVRLKGGMSEVEVRQDVGRGTRRTADKHDCQVFDFDVTDVPEMVRHAKARREIYDDIYGPVREMRYRT